MRENVKIFFGGSSFGVTWGICLSFIFMIAIFSLDRWYSILICFSATNATTEILRKVNLFCIMVIFLCIQQFRTCQFTYTCIYFRGLSQIMVVQFDSLWAWKLSWPNRHLYSRQFIFMFLEQLLLGMLCFVGFVVVYILVEVSFSDIF